MIAPITVIGLGSAALRLDLRALVENADFLAGGARHLEHFPSATGARFTVKNNLAELATELRRRLPVGRCVVLASGDPLFFGIGKSLIDEFGPEAVRVEPALSSMQLAFARAALPWQDADLASVHGRDVRLTLLPLLGRRLIGLFTADGRGPAEVARFFLARGLTDYEAIIAENLETESERVSRFRDLTALLERDFAPLNYLILRRQRDADYFAALESLRACVPGAQDDAFRRPTDRPEVMTRREVRAATLSRLVDVARPGAAVWDVGAGLGTVAVELAVLRPHADVVAVERDPDRAAFVRQNREQFGAYNVRVVEGEAPSALESENLNPSAVFVGGSGKRLAEILELARARLVPGGRLVGNCVTVEHLGLFVQRLREWQWTVRVAEVHVALGDDLGGLTGLKPQRGVFLVAADKPE